MTNEAAKVMLEDAIMTINDFWEASEEDQESALETATAIMTYLLRKLEDEGTEKGEKWEEN